MHLIAGPAPTGSYPFLSPLPLTTLSHFRVSFALFAFALHRSEPGPGRRSGAPRWQRSWSMATAAGVALVGGTPTRSRGAGGMTAASRPLSLRVGGVPQRLPNRLLVDLECGSNCSKTHPQPAQPTRLPRNPLESERLPREHRELQLHLPHGSNWSQSSPPNSSMISVAGERASYRAS